MMPYTLLLVPPPGSGGVLTNTTWIRSQDIVIGLATNPNLTETSLANFQFPFVAFGLPLPWSYVEPCAKNLVSQGCPKAVASAVQQFVNADRSGVFGYIMLPWDAIGVNGQSWLDEMRRTIKIWEAQTGYEIHLGG